VEFIAPSAKPLTRKGTLYYGFDGLSLFKTVLAPLDMARKSFSAESVLDVSTGQTEGCCGSSVEVGADLLDKFEWETKYRSLWR